MTMSTNGSSFSVKTTSGLFVRTPWIEFIFCFHHERYVLLLLLVVVVPMELLIHEIDRSFKKLFVAIMHAGHSSQSSPRMCTPTIMFMAVKYGIRNASASSCTSSLNRKDDNTSSLASSSKKRKDCRSPSERRRQLYWYWLLYHCSLRGRGGRII